MLSTILLLAQLGSPACGWSTGSFEITPYTNAYGGCYVPGPTPEGTRLRPNVLSPSGVTADPAPAPAPYPNQIQYLP